MRFWVVLFYCLGLGVLADVTPFSGFYAPNITRNLETYAGSWFVSRARFLRSSTYYPMIKSLEGASLAMILFADTAMTRDYFDYAVVHLSSSSNRMEDSDKLSDLVKPMVKKMIHVVHSLKQQALELQQKRIDHRSRKSLFDSKSVSEGMLDFRMSNRTLAVIPFSTKSATSYLFKDNFQQNIRHLYFKATFWSIYRYIPHIVVTVATTKDLRVLNSFQLPIWTLVDLSANFSLSAEPRKPGSTHFLPKLSLIWVADKMKKSTLFFPDGRNVFQPTESTSLEKEDWITWSQFSSVMFTEGDQLLVMRQGSRLIDMLHANEHFVLAPHRLQSFSIPQLFSNLSAKMDSQLVESLRAASLITESDRFPIGSCCDNGRFVFANCNNWWFRCPHWGLRNFTTWIRFGEHGFAVPAGSAHQAKCTYSPSRRLCPLSSSNVAGSDRHLDECDRQRSEKPTFAKIDNISQLCPEIASVEYTFSS